MRKLVGEGCRNVCEKCDPRPLEFWAIVDGLKVIASKGTLEAKTI